MNSRCPTSLLFSISVRYPQRQSSTYCQGRVAEGFRTSSTPLLLIDLTMSGNNLSRDRSNVPMTLPARAILTVFRGLDDAHSEAIRSAKAFEFEYGSPPPSRSDRRWAVAQILLVLRQAPSRGSSWHTLQEIPREPGRGYGISSALSGTR